MFNWHVGAIPCGCPSGLFRIDLFSFRNVCDFTAAHLQYQWAKWI